MENREQDNMTARSGSREGVLARYLERSATRLKSEPNRILAFLAGCAMLGTAVLIPLGAAVLAPSQRWLTVLPGTLILLLALVGVVRRPRTGDCVSGLPADSRPCNEFEACWRKRSEADWDIKQAILASRRELTIAGSCLTTMKLPLSDTEIISHVTAMLSNDHNYHVTMLVVGRVEDYISKEQGREALADNFRTGRRILRRFIDEIGKKMLGTLGEDRISLRAYHRGVLPRHFIVKADDVIYVGSYLSHEAGSYSYLVKLMDSPDEGSIKKLFRDEIEYLLANSEKLVLEEDGGNVI